MLLEWIVPVFAETGSIIWRNMKCCTYSTFYIIKLNFTHSVHSVVSMLRSKRVICSFKRICVPETINVRIAACLQKTYNQNNYIMALCVTVISYPKSWLCPFPTR